VAEERERIAETEEDLELRPSANRGLASVQPWLGMINGITIAAAGRFGLPITIPINTK
jgi:hypothetical protein